MELDLVHIRMNDVEQMREYWIGSELVCMVGAYVSYHLIQDQVLTIDQIDEYMFRSLQSKYGKERTGRIQ